MAIRKKKVKKKAKKKAVKKKVVKKKAVKKKAVKKKAVKKKAVKKKAVKKKKRKLNPALMKVMKASSQLSAVIGVKSVTRQKATKYLWDYIKKNGLQDSQNRRNINLDSKLKQIFGNKRQIRMFDVPGGIGKHLQ